MTATNAAHAAQHADGSAAQRPLTVHSCSRLGRRANPPRSTLTDWLLAGRRRR
jgi:hypothetical protein